MVIRGSRLSAGTMSFGSAQFSWFDYSSCAVDEQVMYQLQQVSLRPGIVFSGGQLVGGRLVVPSSSAGDNLPSAGGLAEAKLAKRHKAEC